MMAMWDLLAQTTAEDGYVNWLIQGVPGGDINIMGGLSIGHSKQKSVFVYVSYSERFPK
jgi:hypothetical protein